VDVSDAGTGISFAPATRFPHISGEAVQALGSGITLDRPLDHSLAFGVSVANPSATTTGYQGPKAPNQWFGDALSAKAGSIALLDASSVIVDAIVYGSQQSNSSGNGTIASPEIATLVGDQGKGGCIIVVPSAASGEGKSIGRFSDGADAGSLCTDFQAQAVTTLPAASSAGAINLKVADVVDFHPGQTILIDTGASQERAVIATVGTSGATTVSAATSVGVIVLPVASVADFSEGQIITIGSGADYETAIVASIKRFGAATITVSAPLTLAHTVGAQVSGTGITLAAPLARAHASGTLVANSPPPTPGAANQYSWKSH
jgi:hypothetical protein